MVDQVDGLRVAWLVNVLAVKVVDWLLLQARQVQVSGHVVAVIVIVLIAELLQDAVDAEHSRQCVRGVVVNHQVRIRAQRIQLSEIQIGAWIRR